MSKNDDLVIEEEELNYVCECLDQKADEIENKINSYLEILNYISENAIVSGDFSESLKAYIEYANKMQKQFTLIAQQNKKILAQFLNKIDEDDSYIF